MLIQLKDKQHKLATIMLSLFIGGWLLLLCQTCFAAMDEIDSHNEPITEFSDPCHTPDADEAIEEKSSVSGAHCVGVCDCDVVTATISFEKKSELKEKTKFSQDLYAYTSTPLTLLNRAPPDYRLSKTPERAIFLPLQHYTVLLN